MGMLANAVAKRDKGEAPLSIGTSLALESLGGFGEFPSNSPPIHKHDELWVNLRTIFRNCYNAIDRDYRSDLQDADMIDAVLDDMRVLVSTIELKSLGKMPVIFYISSFKGFETMFPKAKWKTLSTKKQQVEHALEEATLKALLSENYRPHDMDIREYNVKITDRGGVAAMLTHYPIDLLWHRKFTKLTLLESHTGSLKPRAEWYTKLTGGKRYNRIPFNRLTIQVFGDGNGLFASMSAAFKNRILEVAEQDRWTPVTTDDKVRYSINKIYDPREKVFFLELLTG